MPLLNPCCKQNVKDLFAEIELSKGNIWAKADLSKNPSKLSFIRSKHKAAHCAPKKYYFCVFKSLKSDTSDISCLLYPNNHLSKQRH